MNITLFHEFSRPFRHGKSRDHSHDKLELNDEFYRHIDLKFEMMEINEKLGPDGTWGHEKNRVKYKHIEARKCIKSDFGIGEKNSNVTEQFKNKLTVCPDLDDTPVSLKNDDSFDQRKQFQFVVSRCNDDARKEQGLSKCEHDDEKVEAFAGNIRVTTWMIVEQMDYEKHNVKPTTKTLKKVCTHTLNPLDIQTSTMHFMANTIQSDDSFFSVGMSNDEYKFFSFHSLS